MKRVIKLLVVVLLVAGCGYGAYLGYQKWFNKEEVPNFITRKLKLDDLVVSINATGTLEPEELIDVGAQVGGKILAFGKDSNGKELDYGSRVQAGKMLAVIDDALVQTDIKSSKAQVAQAEASILRAEADLEESKARFEQARRDSQRANKISPTQALARTVVENYIATEQQAAAAVKVREAALVQSKANLQQLMANLERDQRNLTYCTIVSPVDGVIIDRRVNIGQTVVSSLNAPSLFLIAKDLKKLEIWVAVNEADIGRIKPGQKVEFSVDAFADRTFSGVVNKIRLNATMSQNVVTYIVEVTADNSDGVLLPYLTANTKFIIEKFHQVLMAPNSALRYQPAEELVEDSSKQYLEAKLEEGQGLLWVINNNKLRAIQVTTGASDGIATVVSSEALQAGMELVTGVDASAAGNKQGSNPFAPKFRPRRKSN